MLKISLQNILTIWIFWPFLYLKFSEKSMHFYMGAMINHCSNLMKLSDNVGINNIMRFAKFHDPSTIQTKVLRFWALFLLIKFKFWSFCMGAMRCNYETLWIYTVFVSKFNKHDILKVLLHWIVYNFHFHRICW